MKQLKPPTQVPTWSVYVAAALGTSIGYQVGKWSERARWIRKRG